jgi:hypothetical protein
MPRLLLLILKATLKWKGELRYPGTEISARVSAMRKIIYMISPYKVNLKLGRKTITY